MIEGVLALDQGSHASRACVFDADGVMRAEHSVAVATRHAGARVEQDPRELVESLKSAARAALAECPDVRVRRAGLATQRSTIVCWSREAAVGDTTGAGLNPGLTQALSPALSWQDRRAADWLDGFEPHTARVRELTGLPLSPHYGASKIRWCLDHLPAVADAARAGTLLTGPLVAWLQSQLCGTTAAVDPANASRTLLYDSARLAWSQELLDLFGIPAGLLPVCRPTRAAFGTLRLGQAADAGAGIGGGVGRTGNPVAAEGIELCALSGDQSAVPFGLGAISEQILYINLGTGAFLQQPMTLRPPAPEPLLGSVLYADPSRTLYTLEGTVNGAGSAVSVFCAGRGLEEPPLWAALEGLQTDALQTRELPVYLNTVGGLGSPWWNSRVAPEMLGGGSALECFAAVIESIVFLIAANAQELRRQNAGAARVLLSGGLSRSDWMCQRLASLLAVPVERAEREASARGMAVLAAPDLAAAWPVTPTTRFEPRPDSALAQRYARFQTELQRRIAQS